MKGLAGEGHLFCLDDARLREPAIDLHAHARLRRPFVIGIGCDRNVLGTAIAVLRHFEIDGVERVAGARGSLLLQVIRVRGRRIGLANDVEREISVLRVVDITRMAECVVACLLNYSPPRLVGIGYERRR